MNLKLKVHRAGYGSFVWGDHKVVFFPEIPKMYDDSRILMSYSRIHILNHWLFKYNHQFFVEMSECKNVEQLMKVFNDWKFK